MRPQMTILLLSVALILAATSVAQGEVVWHDPWLNWDFINQDPNGNTIMVNDFAVIVDDPTGNFNPNPADPNQQWALPFPTFQTFQADYDGDGDLDRMCKWSGANVNPFATAHGGLYMKGSGLVLDAYWTLNCNKVYASTPVTYELTEIRGDPEVHMHLTMGAGYFNDPNHPDYPNAEAGWTHIRTFVNIPADLLNLPDLTSDLDLSTLALFEVDPNHGVPGLPGAGAAIGYDDIIWADPDSFFDVFLAEIPPEYASPEYEALLVADVVNQGQIVGSFWNLNPQSPEPGTITMVALGTCLILRRRRKRAGTRRL